MEILSESNSGMKLSYLFFAADSASKLCKLKAFKNFEIFPTLKTTMYLLQPGFISFFQCIGR